MTRCLSERRLVLAHLGEGRAADRTHLRACHACAARAATLASELSRIDQLLLEAPPASIGHRRAWAPARWMPVTTAAAVALAAAVIVVATRVPRQPPLIGGSAETVSAFAAEVSSAVFAGDANQEVAQATDLAYLQAAVGGEAPCGSGTDFDAHCDADDADATYWDD